MHRGKRSHDRGQSSCKWSMISTFSTGVRACPGGGNTREGKSERTGKKKRKKKKKGGGCIVYSCGSMCIRKSHVVTCARGQRGWHSRSSFRSPVKPYSRKSLQAFRIWNVFLLDERGGVVTSERRKWVWKSQCVCSMSPCPPQVSHMPRKLPLSSHTSCRKT